LTTVELAFSHPYFLPGDPSSWTYWQFGKTSSSQPEHWYEFLYNDVQKTGAVFLDSTHIVLHFRDGGPGDNDLVPNGVIEDPGGFGFAPPPAAALQPDVLAPGKTMLTVTGTPGNDTINLIATDPYGDIDVIVDGQFLGNFLPTGHIIVNGQDGNDTIRLGGGFGKSPINRIRVPALVMDGNGNDVLDASASSADNVLAAGAGISALIGGAGRDILIASPQSTFKTGHKGDLIIKGITPFNSDSTALGALRAEWSRTGTDDHTRIDHLLHGGGLNGATVLAQAVPVGLRRRTRCCLPRLRVCNRRCSRPRGRWRRR
jgi:Ca2+-binding RTX toxin-like protein